MANNRIGRTVQTTTCEGDYYDKENRKQHFKITIYGKYNIYQLTRKIERFLQTNRFLIDPETISYDEFYASMELEKFVKLAEHKPTTHRKDV